MSDFNKPQIRLHTVNMREQFVAPLMDGRLKAITRLNGRGYNAGDYLRFSVLPMQSSDVQFSMTTDDERDAIQNRFYRITFAMYGKGLKEGYVTLSLELVREKAIMDTLRSEIDRMANNGQKVENPLDAYADLFDTAYPQGYDSPYTKRHAQPSLDSIAEVATEAASSTERPRGC
ncbi:DUF3850 domain-containing protein [Collinsella sp. AF20-14LB]|uniref:DUF3850 domain-containing protein n=1 Tax=Collinsella sp. AF20-14LB TaxID=2292221 RepID=UPI000E4B6A56|nr:DUF3850 domain-containing protein [Collinsella sp. AF20-14LB]RGS89303.1 hypothetical protein DWX63_10725 [Collinsella sp. AF20-14LB]